jgi:Zn ribbon nucleic-acid-binding protein
MDEPQDAAGTCPACGGPTFDLWRKNDPADLRCVECPWPLPPDHPLWKGAWSAERQAAMKAARP